MHQVCTSLWIPCHLSVITSLLECVYARYSHSKGLFHPSKLNHITTPLMMLLVHGIC